MFNDKNEACIAIAIHDCVYLNDFCVKTIPFPSSPHADEDPIADWVIQELEAYEHKDYAKFIGAGIPEELGEKCPRLCSRLWLELDIVPIIESKEQEGGAGRKKHWDVKCVDEQADSMARKCIMYDFPVLSSRILIFQQLSKAGTRFYLFTLQNKQLTPLRYFGPCLTPMLQVGYRGIVEVDSGFQARLLTLSDFKSTCGPTTWEAMMKYATSLKKKGTKIAFFSSTPQGGGVALMRHALVRFATLAGVDLTWYVISVLHSRLNMRKECLILTCPCRYVPKPKPGVFRITKNMHNILQGVSKHGERISSDDKKSMTDWIEDNAERYWLSDGGPLRPPEEGGADVIIVRLSIFSLPIVSPNARITRLTTLKCPTSSPL